MRLSRRGIQVALAVLWLLDGALQLQPFMLGHGFAEQIIASAGEGQPHVVAAAVHWSAQIIDTHPTIWDVAFAVVQLTIGAALLIRRTARPALAASIAWALGVWYFGEGLGGLASGHSDLLTGAPGAVLLYAVLAVAAWPGSSGSAGSGEHRSGRPQALLALPAWLPSVWAVLWVGAGLLRALPGQNSGGALATEIGANADGAPGWLAHLDRALSHDLESAGTWVVVVLVAVEVAVGVAALRPGASRRSACWIGIAIAVAFWLVGQNMGDLFTGQATDPNTAPLIVLLALAVLSVPKSPRSTLSRADAEAQQWRDAAPQLV